MEPNLLWQGLELMLVGMGTVIFFLTLLVLSTSLMSRLVLVWQPEPVDVRGLPAGEVDDEIAAIAAAITLHRRRREEQSRS